MGEFKSYSKMLRGKTRLFAAILTAGTLACGSAIAADAQIDAAQIDLPQIDPAPVASIEASAVQVEVQPTLAVTETTVSYRVHRSPVRSDSLAFHVVTMDGEQELRIQLPGIEGLSFNKICRSTSGARVACGSRARIQFVNMIVRREIACRHVGVAGQAPTVQACEIDGQDLAEWIVRNGLGRPVGEGRYVAAAREARQAERGMWVDAEIRGGMTLARN